MSIFRGMNFGPELGPIATGVERAMQGRWVGIRKYDTTDADPLHGGHWGTEWHWYDPPDGGGPDQHPIGTGIDGGYQHMWFNPPPPPDDCPKWARPIPGLTGTQESCTEAQKAKLREAYHHLTTDPGWAKALDPIIGDDGVPLMTCLRRVWCDLAVNCVAEGEVPVAGTSSNWAENLYRLKNNVREHVLLSRLVLACGGTLIDAYALAGISVSGDPYPFVSSELEKRNVDLIGAVELQLIDPDRQDEIVYDPRLRRTRYLIKGKYGGIARTVTSGSSLGWTQERC